MNTLQSGVALGLVRKVAVGMAWEGSPGEARHEGCSAWSQHSAPPLSPQASVPLPHSGQHQH